MLKKLVATTLIIYTLGIIAIIVIGVTKGRPDTSGVGISNVQELLFLAQQSTGSRLDELDESTLIPIVEPTSSETPSDVTPAANNQSETPQGTSDPLVIATPTQVPINVPNQPVPTATPVTPTPTPRPNPTPTSAPPASGCGSGGTCTAAQIAQHNSKSDCWVIFGAKAYNVTAYVNKHPGGAAAFDSTTCGHDITVYMYGYSGTSGVDKHNHSQSAYSTINSYFIANISG